MSLQWEIVAVFLYTEMIVLLLMISPIIPPIVWSKVFKSKMLKALVDQSYKYCALVMFVLIVCFLDALREVRKYSALHDQETTANLDVEIQVDMRLFRAQRNVFVSGFALLLSLIISQLIVMLRSHGDLLHSTSTAVFHKKTDGLLYVEQLRDQVKELERDLNQEKKEKKAVASQCNSVSKEYDRLAEELKRLQNELN